MAIKLIMTCDDGTTRSFDLQEGRTTIGSRRSCDLHVAIPSIAPLHCEITIKHGGINLLNSDPDANTYLNDTAIKATKLVHEDRVRIGPVEFTVNISNDETVIRRL